MDFVKNLKFNHKTWILEKSWIMLENINLDKSLNLAKKLKFCQKAQKSIFIRKTLTHSESLHKMYSNVHTSQHPNPESNCKITQTSTHTFSDIRVDKLQFILKNYKEIKY